MKRVLDCVRRNRKLVILTFELFWIAVFLLEALEQGGSGMTQFVYVNF
ncbi:hypothetical protein [Anaeromyxobacter dehalogenans]|nr:hypothetical protein [Anaeromyxobacter dehalogenans]